MDALTTLLSHYTLETIIISLVMAVVAIKFLGDLFEWCYQKLRHYFNVKDEQLERHEETINKLDNVEQMMLKFEREANNREERLGNLESGVSKYYDQQELIMNALDKQINSFMQLETQIKNLSDQMQDATRTFIMEKYDKYVNDIGAIDLASLQDIERRFVCYKAAGGDTFVDGLMEKIRELPMITVEQINEEQIHILKNKIGGC